MFALTSCGLEPGIMAMRGMDDIRLNGEVVVQKLCSVNIIGMYAANLGCRQEDIIRFFLIKKSLYGCLIPKV